MPIMFSKKIIFTSLAALSFATPFVAHADDLTIINNTNYDSTSIINNGPCSDMLRDHGVTHPHSTNQVPQKTFAAACIRNKQNCTAAVYMTNNCNSTPGANPVAIVIVDVNTGIKSVTPTSTPQGFTVAGNGFAATIAGGPAIQKNWFQRIFGL